MAVRKSAHRRAQIRASGFSQVLPTLMINIDEADYYLALNSHRCHGESGVHRLEYSSENSYDAYVKAIMVRQTTLFSLDH